jgi:NADH dehydrogenase
LIKRRETGRTAPPAFSYFDKGNMAVIGRFFAIVDSGYLRLSGVPAWMAWAFIHLLFLPSGGNRVRVWTQWVWSYFTRSRSSELILEAHVEQTPIKNRLSDEKTRRLA